MKIVSDFNIASTQLEANSTAGKTNTKKKIVVKNVFFFNQVDKLKRVSQSAQLVSQSVSQSNYSTVAIIILN